MDVLRIGCKINLYLEITGVRQDGYHELLTLFYPVAEPHDTLSLELSPGRHGLELACTDPALETPDNLAAKAYQAFAGATGYRPGLSALLDKGIPSGAGLGGGSADAAAMLGWLNARAGGAALSAPDLSALAAGLGADVPFFLLNRPAWATGIGDALEPAPDSLAGWHVVIAVPEQRVNTGWAYKAWDAANGFPPAQGPRTALTSLCPASMRPFCASGAFLANSFEPVVYREFPAVRLVKERLLALGAGAACLSGSGAAVFGLFHDAARATAAARALSAQGARSYTARL